MIVTTKGKNATEVKNLEEAIQVCANFRDTADQGSSIGATAYYRLGAGRVFDDGAKKPYAQIHYNGRVEFLYQEVTAITDGDGITRQLSRPIRLL